MEQEFNLESLLDLWIDLWLAFGPVLFIMAAAGLFISGMAMHKAASWMGAAYSSFGKGLVTVLLQGLASTILSVPAILLVRHELLTESQVVNITYVVMGWLIDWLIIKSMYKVSFGRAIGISVLSAVIAFFLALLLLIPLFLLISAILP